jgi:hypothetical protein
MDKWLSCDSMNLQPNTNLLFCLQNMEKAEHHEFKTIEKFLFDLARLSFNTTNVQVNNNLISKWNVKAKDKFKIFENIFNGF